MNGAGATAFDRITHALEAKGRKVTPTSRGAMAQCPAHDDTNPSLNITAIEGSVLLHCHAGCDTGDVLAAVGLGKADLYDNRDGWADRNGDRWHAAYIYPDGRKVWRSADKNFTQRGNTKGRALFHGDRVGDADVVYWVEGEKDVLAIESAGGVAVCSAMGAGKAHLADRSVLQGKHVIVPADRDEPGRAHARQVAELLISIAKSVRIVEPAVGKDVADHIAAGRSLDELVDAAQPSLLEQRAVNGAWLEAQIFGDLEYAVDGMIPEGLGIFVGPPKKGKSFFVADIGLAVAAGATALGRIKVTQRPVLYLALEDGHRRLKDRFHRILDGAPIPTGIEVVITCPAMPFSPRGCCARPRGRRGVSGRVRRATTIW